MKKYWPSSKRKNSSQPALIKLIIIASLLASGALQTLSLAPFGDWFLGPISIVIILLATKALNAPSQSFKGFQFGWFFGLGLFGSGASWVYVSIHTYGYASPFLAGTLTLLFVAGLALFPALSFYLFGKLKTSSKTGNALLFTACWVLGDIFRTYFLTGFPWLFLGYGHLNSPLAGWIPIAGVYGLTALSVASGVALYFCASLLLKGLPFLVKGKKPSNKVSFRSHYHPKKTAFKLCFITCMSLFWLSGPTLNSITWTEKIDHELSVAVLQTNIPQEEKWKPSQRYKTLHLLEQMTTHALGQDLILWPETAVPLLYDRARPFLDKISALASSQNSNIISGIPFRQLIEKNEHILHNSIVSIGHGDGIYHKQKLVPFGEYVPLQDVLRGLIAFFDLPMSDFRTGSADQVPLTSGAFQVSPFICYEVVYPDFVRNNIKGSQFLLTISNDSWFGESIGPLQHLEMAQMRAAENQRYMVRGTNNGVSAVIDQKGQITAQTEQFVKTTLFSTIQLYQGETPFMRFGSWPIVFISLVIIALSLFNRRKHH
ncbi:MAG: apolipoprotein N-acyltransferase [Oleiphilus sp.]